VDEVTNSVVKAIAASALTSSPEKNLAIEIFGRLIGETLAHEIIHSLIGNVLSAIPHHFHNASPGLPSDIMNFGFDRSFEVRTGFELDRTKIAGGDLTEMIVGDKGIVFIDIPTGPTRIAMTVGFVAFSLGVGWFALTCRSVLPGWSWLALAVAAAATTGAAIFPLRGEGADFDAVHGAFAGFGYVFLVVAPLLAAGPFRRRGDAEWALASLAVAVAAAVCLVASVSVEANGLFQRLGLTAVDAWIVVLAASIMRKPPLAPRPLREGLK
jgi:hypothetical protein